MGKATKGTTARKQTKEKYYGDFRNWACFTFSLDNNGDILMLIETLNTGFKEINQLNPNYTRATKRPASIIEII